MARGVKCQLVCPHPGSQEPGSFNGEPRRIRHGYSDICRALTDQDIITGVRHVEGIGTILSFRVQPDLVDVVRETLTSSVEVTGCARKKKHPTQERALREVFFKITSPRYYNPTGAPLVPYACPECGHWHIGHKYKNERSFPV